jgi:hypothetical protein
MSPLYIHKLLSAYSCVLTDTNVVHETVFTARYELDLYIQFRVISTLKDI